ncbi:MAG TPA: hypothetical protein ENK49_03820 [Gammaproteobacteria bacterium]|nr:hypothetical protein [Gammaproteobacteria bacterium]
MDDAQRVPVAIPDTLQQLLAGQRVPLGSWVAEPLLPAQALACLPAIQRRLQSVIAGRPGDFPLRLADLVVRYWCGRDTAPLFRNLLALYTSRRQRAQLELVYGQLLMARKRLPAGDHLDNGFALAAHLLEPEEYFQVLKRHELLHRLHLQPAPSAPAGLDTLLTEAQVIRRLAGHVNAVPSPHTRKPDTLG